MWDALPIQRAGGVKGDDHLTTIHPDFPYPAYPDVLCKKWRDVDVHTQKWAMAIWCVHFGIRRCPLGPDDLFLWIPYIATLTAKLGVWRQDDLKEIKMASVGCNYVGAAHRGKGLAQHMILTMAHTLSPRHKFMFELQTVPPSLDDAVPFLRFFYVWTPMLFKGGYVQADAIDARGIPGFHPDSWDGYCMYRNAEGQRVIVDPHDDIVWSDGPVVDFDGPSSRYVRWFSPYGNIRVYAQNMYFSDPDYSRPALSG